MEEKKMPPEAETEAAEETAEIQENELQELRRKNDELRRELEERKALSGRLESEISEFSEMFPDVALTDIPESIWAEVKSGLPLSAAYARHERKRVLGEKRAAEINNTVRESSSGSVSGTPDYYYTAEEVRKMSAAEVKKNYSHIINSMKRWN
ncbi:MAG: hypothetical protein IJZ89_03915 [Clostridia bacterium]|nr:hypothetical protein [Clostridia bacterium]